MFHRFFILNGNRTIVEYAGKSFRRGCPFCLPVSAQRSAIEAGRKKVGDFEKPIGKPSVFMINVNELEP
jgi:hypothetical protein